jgi:hypothetical protein
MKSKMHPNSFFLFSLVIVLMLTSCTSTPTEVASTPVQVEPQIIEVTKIVAGPSYPAGCCNSNTPCRKFLSQREYW